ncbi:OB-fold nucleic acid binding domain-containing protein [Streptomyces kaniharaensis]|uniref:OB-fold nucleic acid binding domain-containing protein n=1 Tax=Streptomyces kaniharaensis TaxID=212423 RepID=A0A6N7KNF3_9ACTN|nr:OB-fold nucleic acid binding domain-containing protein [Streptomyces kaniharaensis]MQS12265.1 OB-fold nucleic acid binding domain-containing protein [Streptomyces kaniharaensis]
MSGDNSSDQPQGRLRRMLSRLTSSSEELQAEELREESAAESGCTPIAGCADRDLVTVAGTLRTVTLRPRAGVPALEAELFDGTEPLDMVWLGRRSIAGIEPGRRLVASGRISQARGRRVLFNPRYELRPVGHGSE